MHTRRPSCSFTGVNSAKRSYPTAQGGFVYVGAPRYDFPVETDLAAVFEAAELAGIVWLKFDAGSATIDGLPVYSPLQEET